MRLTETQPTLNDMQKYFGARIADVLDKINHELFIPSIQRPYVWEPEQVLKLFDSLMRGYPINTFLFWSLQPEHLGDWDVYRFVREFRQGDIHNDAAALSTEKPVTLVLDGQQRLTSLLIGLDGTYTVRNGLRGRGSGWVTKMLMLDLLQSPEDTEEEDEGAAARELYYGFKFFAVDRPPRSDAKAVWFRVSLVRSIISRDQLLATIDRLFLLHPDLTSEQHQLIASNLTRLWQVVHEEESLAFYLEREQSYDKVLDIFIRANDGGTKLSRSDLLMSMVSLRWHQFNARSETESVTYAMREALNQESAFDRDYLLRAGLFFNDLDFAFQLRNFTARNIGIIEARWTAVRQALLDAANLFKRFGITGGALTGVNAVMLIACYLFKRQQQYAGSHAELPLVDEERVRRWITGVLFHGVLSGAANVTMEFYRRVVNEQLRDRPGFPVQALTDRMTVRGRSMNFDDEAVGRFIAQESKSRIFTPCCCLLYDRTNWLTKDWQVVQVFGSHRLLDDRLRVQGMSNEDIRVCQSWAHRLANYIVLGDDDAREFFGMHIDDWVTSRPQGFWARHALPEDPTLYDECHFLEFVQARRRLLRDRLQTVLKDDVIALAQPEHAGASAVEQAA